jgi:hypothetical protein
MTIQDLEPMHSNDFKTEACADICRELPAAQSGPSPWLLLVPAGHFQGRDGRAWVNDRPGAILDHFARNRVDIPVDWEHATELKAPKGEEAPASGWIKELTIRDGAMWGRVEWTPRGQCQVQARNYRYYSPAFNFERASKRVVGIHSVGLTNRPNLYVPALNVQGVTPVAYGRQSACALNAQQTAIAAAFGNSAEVLARYGDNRSQSGPVELNSVQQKIAAAFGNSAEDLARYGV